MSGEVFTKILTREFVGSADAGFRLNATPTPTFSIGAKAQWVIAPASMPAKPGLPRESSRDSRPSRLGSVRFGSKTTE